MRHRLPVPPERLAPGPHHFTSRLEAFSDLVFGFSLSLLATRLDIPARVEDIFNSARWFAVIGTFGLVCRFWLEHYRIFRHRFVASMFDAIVNFVFLFAIAVLPYSVQTFLRFQLVFASFAIYVADFSLILFTLAILRVRNLRQRRDDPDLASRLRDWRRSVIQLLLVVLMSSFLFALGLHKGTYAEAMRSLDWYPVAGFVLIVCTTRFAIRGLPAFLS